MSFSKEFIDKVESRINYMKNLYGHNSVTCNFHSYVEGVVSRHISKKEHQEKQTTAQNTNNGEEWLRFRRKYFSTIYLRDKGNCFYCTKKLSRKESTLDHKIPPLRGGKNTLDNITLSCNWCNNDKGILNAEEYYYKQLHNKARGIEPQ